MKNPNIATNPKTIARHEKQKREAQEIEDRRKIAAAAGITFKWGGKWFGAYHIFKDGKSTGGCCESLEWGLSHYGF